MPSNKLSPLPGTFERDTSELIKVFERGAATISDQRVKSNAEQWLQKYQSLTTSLGKNSKAKHIFPKLQATVANVRLIREDWLRGLRIVLKEFKAKSLTGTISYFAPQGTKVIFPSNILTRLKGDAKIHILAIETNINWDTECWNSCGILMRIILERSLDRKQNDLKNEGLKRKISISLSDRTFGKSVSEALLKLDHSTKITGDIVAHDSNIVLDKNDIELAIIPLSVLLKDIY